MTVNYSYYESQLCANHLQLKIVNKLSNIYHIHIYLILISIWFHCKHFLDESHSPELVQNPELLSTRGEAD